MKAKKSLGQNFLMHQSTADRIAAASGVQKNDTVLEIGPGTGMLTRALLAQTQHVIAVETDRELIPVLQETFSKEIASKHLTLVEGDIRTFNRSVLPETYHLVANIPYYLTGDIIRSFLTGANLPSSMTLLVQKEVAERIARSKKESILSVAVKTYGTPKYQFTVPRGAFSPAPKVDSAVISILHIVSPFKNRDSEEHFFDVLHAGFAHKRKLLARNLEVVAPREQVVEAFSAAQIEEKTRAEDVPAQKWHIITENLAS